MGQEIVDERTANSQRYEIVSHKSEPITLLHFETHIFHSPKGAVMDTV